MVNKFVLISIIPLLVLSVLGGVGYNEYLKLQQITAEIKSIEITDASLTGASVNFDLSLYNPAYVSLPIEELTMDIFAQGLKIGTVESESFTLESQKTVDRTFSLRVSFLDLGLSAIELFKQKDVQWIVEGKAIVTLPLGYKYTHNFKLPKEQQ